MNPYFNNPSFTFSPQNPNPNPNSFSFTQPQNPNLQPPKPSSSSSFTFSSSPSPDLQTTLKTLKHFINLATTTINSIAIDTDPEDDRLSSCPFDPNHKMPPKSLFKHTLTCPSSPSVISNLGFFDSLNYPNTFKSREELQKENWSLGSIQESDYPELNFSIDDYIDLGASFAYRDCPGVVCASEMDNNSTKKMFTLPRVLSIECANFAEKCANSAEKCANFAKSDGNGYLGREALDKILLPSEVWSARSEIEVWSSNNGYPSFYSYNVVRVCLCLDMVNESEMLTWVIVNSPCYGVVIDVAMRDHVFMLVKLCLKAICREACELVRGVCNESDGGLSVEKLSFKCPVLVEVMTWLASQLSVLYGEVNGRLFAVNMLKRCLQSAAASGSLVFTDGGRDLGDASCRDGNESLSVAVDGMDCESVGSKVSGDGVHEDSDASCKVVSSLNGSLIYFSQVAAAVAALHERALLEEKIKGLRRAGSLSKSQLLSEYSYMSMRAHEERRKRPNYRPILEHDGLLWQRYHNQDSGKTKTREELLAEERDYKRRRMSYRGKKAKRSTTEVMRDIIEQHMDEIKQAGGIGCFIKGSGVNEGVAAGSASITANDALVSKGCDLSESGKDRDSDFGKTLSYDHKSSRRNEGVSSKDCKSTGDGLRNSDQHQRRDTHGRNEPLIRDHQRSSRKDKHNREYRSRSPETRRSHGSSHERHRHRRTRDEVEVTGGKYDKEEPVTSHRSRDSGRRSFSSVSNPSIDYSDRKYDRVSEVNDVRKGSYGRHRSESVQQTVIEDRYDPSESDDRYEDKYHEFSSGSEYVRPDKVYKSSRR